MSRSRQNRNRRKRELEFAEAQKHKVSNGAINYIAEKMCLNKKIYKGSIHATRDAAAMSSRVGEKLNAYRCPFCGNFHVGHVAKEQV